MRELIVYATPTGELAARCDAAWNSIATTAQEFPPHVTITGFFHRPADRTEETIEALEATLSDIGPMESLPILSVGRTDEWVGLIVESPWMEAVGQRFSTSPTEDGDDPIRPKFDLHLSVSYGKGFVPNVDGFDDVEGLSADGWHIDLWERHPDGDWQLHKRVAPRPPDIVS